MPLRPELLGLCRGSDRAVWRLARNLARPSPGRALPPLASRRVRSRPLIRSPPMMDTQRLIALIVFTFSALMLWEAWQKHNAPKVPPVAAKVEAPTGVPQPTVPLATPGAKPVAPPPAGPVAASGEAIVVKTDLFEVEINTLGGD